MLQDQADEAAQAEQSRQWQNAGIGLPNACEPLLTEKQLSHWLGVSLPTLQRLRSSGKGPRFVQLSERRIAYRRSAVEQWLEQQTALRVGAEVAA